ncbi:hypothetical protein MRB53_001542 [Persea americana]|uniref:Uncharacterized protein n=1 Tax=Persea americana TaxID=3435 RepID=A0ACC2MS44_PERAE|nr:hypothetical protein MRB53_001542 [Persea americana]
MVMHRGGREALTYEWDDLCAWRENMKRHQGFCAAAADGAVCAWRKKGQRSAGVREMKSRETGAGAAFEMGLRRGLRDGEKEC